MGSGSWPVSFGSPPYGVVPSKAQKRRRDWIGRSLDMLSPAARHARTMPAASRFPARYAPPASVFTYSACWPPIDAGPPFGEMSPCAPLAHTSTTSVLLLPLCASIACSARRAATPALSPENIRLPSPNDVGWTAKFDHSAIGRPFGVSTRRTVTVGSTDG